MLYSLFSLVIYFIHCSVYMSIPVSQFIPPLPSHPVSIRLFSTSVSLFLMLLLYNDNLSWICGKVSMRGQGSVYNEKRGGSSSLLPCGDIQTGQREHEHFGGTSQFQYNIWLSCPTGCEPTVRFYVLIPSSGNLPFFLTPL